MSSVVNAIQNIVSVVVTILLLPSLVVIALVETAFGGSFEDHMSRHLEFIFGLFGLTGEDVISTVVEDIRLLPEDSSYTDLMTQLALIHQDTQLGIIDILKNMTLGILGKYNAFHDFGDEYVNGLPECNIKVDIFPSESTKIVIDGVYGVDAILDTTKFAIPTKEEFCYWWLKENYSLVLETLTFTYNSLPYVIQTMDYNYGTNNYDIVATNAGTPITLSVLAPTSSSHLIVTWHNTGDTASNYWVYKKGSGTYPSLDRGYDTTDLEMLPIIEIRNNGVNLNSNPTSTKYLQSKEILATIGVDIDAISTSLSESPSAANTLDSFIYFGLDVTDTDPVVSRMVYRMFDFIMRDGSLDNSAVGTEFGSLDDVNNYRITFKEGNYNSSVAWSQQKFNIYEGVIGPKGTHTTEVSGDTLILKAQLSEEQYGEYQIKELFTVTAIHRDGLWGAVTKTLLAGPVILPLSHHLIQEFSPIEQMTLFNKSLRMSIYAAEIQHLEWYQTEGFLITVQVLLIVGAILYVAFTGDFSTGSKIMMMTAKMAAMAVASYALKKILESNADGWVKVLATIAYLALAYSMGNADKDAMFMTSDQITAAVTNFSAQFSVSASQVFGALKMGTDAWNMQTEKKMEALIAESTAYGQKAEEAFKTIEGRQALLEAGLSTEFVERLANMDMVEPFMQGPDVNYYTAIQMQHDHVAIAVSIPYETMYDYDKYYRLGVV